MIHLLLMCIISGNHQKQSCISIRATRNICFLREHTGFVRRISFRLWVLLSCERSNTFSERAVSLEMCFYSRQVGERPFCSQHDKYDCTKPVKKDLTGTCQNMLRRSERVQHQDMLKRENKKVRNIHLNCENIALGTLRQFEEDFGYLLQWVNGVD
jgi:hypothetical protein